MININLFRFPQYGTFSLKLSLSASLGIIWLRIEVQLIALTLPLTLYVESPRWSTVPFLIMQ